MFLSLIITSSEADSLWLHLTIILTIGPHIHLSLSAGCRNQIYKKGYLYHRLSSARSPEGAEISWHDGQCPSLQPVLGHQHSFLLNTRKTVFQTFASCPKSFNRISHPSRILSFYGQNFLCLLTIAVIQCIHAICI